MNSHRSRPPGAVMWGSAAGDRRGIDMVDRLLRAPRIDDQPVLAIGLALELLADELAHQRARAVGADEIASAHWTSPRRRTREWRRRRRRFRQNPSVRRRARREPSALRRAPPQRLFELGLVERHEFGMPVDLAERVDPPELAEQEANTCEQRESRLCRNRCPRVPPVAERCSASLSSAMARGAMKISLALSTTSARTP